MNFAPRSVQVIESAAAFPQRMDYGMRAAIDFATKRALPAMLCHRQVSRLNLLRDFSAGQESGDVLGATIGLDELSREMIEM